MIDIKYRKKPVVVEAFQLNERGLRGELYPCKPDIFEKTYEVLDDDNSM